MYENYRGYTNIKKMKSKKKFRLLGKFQKTIKSPWISNNSNIWNHIGDYYSYYQVQETINALEENYDETTINYSEFKIVDLTKICKKCNGSGQLLIEIIDDKNLENHSILNSKSNIYSQNVQVIVCDECNGTGEVIVNE